MFKRVYLAVLLVILLSAGCGSVEQKAEAPAAVKEISVSAEELVLNGEDPERAAESRAIWDWAVECGLADEFSYDNFLQSLEAENKKREMVYAQGGPVYGPVKFTPLQYYRRLLGEYEQGIRECLLRDIEPSDLAEFYETHQENYRAADTIEAEYTIRENGRVTCQEKVKLDSGTMRALSESDEELVQYLLQLEEGGQCVWIGRNGEEKQLLCIRREQGAFAPLEEVSGAVVDQYGDVLFERELTVRAGKYQTQEEENRGQRKSTAEYEEGQNET